MSLHHGSPISGRIAGANYDRRQARVVLCVMKGRRPRRKESEGNPRENSERDEIGIRWRPSRRRATSPTARHNSFEIERCDQRRKMSRGPQTQAKPEKKRVLERCVMTGIIGMGRPEGSRNRIQRSRNQGFQTP